MRTTTNARAAIPTMALVRGQAFVGVSRPLMHDPASRSGYPIMPVADKRAIARQVAEQALAKPGA